MGVFINGRHLPGRWYGTKSQSRQSANSKLFLLPPVLGGGAHSLARDKEDDFGRERGWESPNSDEGTYTLLLFMYTYFVD
jgi:hypothetical protein